MSARVLEPRDHTVSSSPVIPTFIKELLAGAIAGALSKSAVAPLDRVKILLQVTNKLERLSRGNTASVYRIVPYASFHFYAYERYRAAALHVLHKQEMLSSSNRRAPPWVDLLAGSCAGVTAVLLTYPLDLVRTRLAWSGNSATGGQTHRHSVMSMLQLIWAQEGIKGIYRGIYPTILGVMPYAGLKFYTYQALKSMWYTRHVRRNPGSEIAKPPLLWSLLFGGIAGLSAQTVTFPLDVVRRRMQVEAAEPRAVATPTMWAHFHEILRANGVRGLFRGLTINYMKVVPQTAIGFATYDAAKSYLGLKNNL